MPNVTVDCVKPCRLFGNSVEQEAFHLHEILGIFTASGLGRH